MSLNAQIPNASFEDWQIVNNIEQPSGWHTNNANGFISVEKVSALLAQNSYAMKVSSNAPSFEGKMPGFAYTTFAADKTSNTLNLIYRINSIELGKIEVLISQLINGTDTQIGYWKKEIISEGVEQISIPFVPVSSNEIRLEIKASTTLTGVGFEGYAEIIVDDLTLTADSSRR